LYLVGVAVGIVGAFLMAGYTQPRSFGVGLMGLAAAWVGTTGGAWGAVVRGPVALPKEWVVGADLGTFAFVAFPVISDTFPILQSKLGNNGDDASANVTWLSWVLPLAIYEVIRLRKRFSASNV